MSRTLPLLLILLLAGCTDGPRRVDVSGTATHGGKPIPAGRIYFNPDLAKGNDGPQGYADIKDGVFDTRLGGRGACGGASVVIIQGHESAAEGLGPPLFDEFKITIDLPKTPQKQDFDVPANAPKSKLGKKV